MIIELFLIGQLLSKRDSVDIPTVVGPTPNDKPKPIYDTKPKCGVGTYAYKDPLTQKWSCLVIPKGR